MLAALDAQLPDGLTARRVEHSHGKPASSRLRGVDYAVDVADDLDWDEAIARYQPTRPSSPAPRPRRPTSGST